MSAGIRSELKAPMGNPIAKVLLGFCMAICLVATACAEGYGTGINGVQQGQAQQPDTAAPTATATTSPLTREALRNAEYVLPWSKGEKVQLQDGTLSRPPEVWSLLDPISFGDLDDDGVDDAALVLSYSGGGSGTFFSLLAVLGDDGGPVHVASYGIGDRIRLTSLEIADGVVSVKMVAHGPDDGLCCPTQDTVATFLLSGNALELLSESPPGNLTAIAQRQARPTVDPTRIDPDLAEAFDEMRNAVFEEVDELYDWFVSSGASAHFGPLERTDSQYNLSSNLITINEEYRNESPIALAYALIWPLANLHAINERGGPPRTSEECIADRIAAHSAQALWWFGRYGESGKQDPTELEQRANNNLAIDLESSLGIWVRETYREQCATFGEPQARADPNPTVSKSTVEAPSSCLSPDEFTYLVSLVELLESIGEQRRASWDARSLTLNYPSNSPQSRDAFLRYMSSLFDLAEAFRNAYHSVPQAPTERTRVLNELVVATYGTILAGGLGFVDLSSVFYSSHAREVSSGIAQAELDWFNYQNELAEKPVCD